jgi:hypothetical protein
MWFVVTCNELSHQGRVRNQTTQPELVACVMTAFCIALHCIALHCIALHCIALHCIALYCIDAQHHRPDV